MRLIMMLIRQMWEILQANNDSDKRLFIRAAEIPSVCKAIEYEAEYAKGGMSEASKATGQVQNGRLCEGKAHALPP